MPYYDDFQDEDELNNPSGPQLAGASQVVGGGQAQASNTAVPKGPTSSDRFQNLNSYLDANKGNEFGENFASKVQGDVSKGAQAQTEASGQFQNLANAGAIGQNTSLVDEAVTDPTKFIQNQSKVDQFKQQRDAQYQGPNSFADAGDLYQKTAGATTKALDVAEKGQTEGGRFALLDSYFGRPEYSQGQKSLDNLLVSGNNNATQGLAQATQNARDQMTAFQEQNKSLSDYAAKKRGETEDTKNYARSALGIDAKGALLPSVNAVQTPPKTIGTPVTNPGGVRGALLGAPENNVRIPAPVSGRTTPAGTQLSTTGAPSSQAQKGVLSNLYGELENRASTMKNNYEGQLADITKALASKDLSSLTREERDLLGIADQTGSVNTFGIEASNYFQPKTIPSDISRSSVASSQEATKLAALAQLAGIDPRTLIDTSKAGTGVPAAQFNKAGFNNAVETEVKKYASQPNTMVPTVSVNEGSGIEGIQTALAKGKIPTSIYPSDSAPGYIPGVSGLQQQKDWLTRRISYIEDGIKKGSGFKWDDAAPRPLLHAISGAGASMTPQNAKQYLDAVKKAITLTDAKLDQIRKGTLPNVGQLKYS